MDRDSCRTRYDHKKSGGLASTTSERYLIADKTLCFLLTDTKDTDKVIYPIFTQLC